MPGWWKRQPDGGGAASVLTQRIQIIVEDLTTLEVHTAIIPGLTARKMPSVHEALIETARQYDRVLLQVDAALATPGNYEQVYASYQRILASSQSAMQTLNQTLAAPGEDFDEQQARFVIVGRIEANAKEVVGILDEVQKFTGQNPDSAGLTLAPQNQLRVRRIWDVGTEEVVMQTHVQINGDVLTRVTARYATEKYRILHQIHQQGTQVSLNMWKELAATVSAIFKDLIGGLKLS